MKITKLTEEYGLAEQNGVYFLNFGNLKHNNPATIRIRFEDVDSKNFILRPTCQCTVAAKEEINKTTVEYNITYSASTIGNFTKTLVATNGNKRTELKLIGQTIA
jgi:hypothetical protein